jgi:hypothetical protein
MWLCFALPACACVLLLAVTNKICQDLSVIPFLWVLPLSLYLLSFIVCFDSPRWYWRPFWLPILVVSICASLWVMVGSSLSVPDYTVLYPIRWLLEIAGRLSMFKIIGIYLGTLFVCCMVCHGEVYRLRPSAQKLTGYYLLIAAGGAFGGLFVAVLAPLIFKGYFELHVGLLTAALLVIAVLYIDQESPLHGGRHIWAWALVLLALIGLGAGFYHDVTESLTDTVEIARTFYGVLKVNEYYANDPEMHQFTLEHGSTTHGLQFVSPSKRRMPTSYYTSRSGIGRTMEYFPQHANRRIGLVGLGTGSFVAWVRAGDYVRIYEINNQVQRLAHNRFHYLEDTEAKTEVVLGDARLSLEREPDQQFDIIILDAFSSDSVPIHLLTREAFELYRRHLRSDGIIAVHISNRYLDLEPIVIRVAEYFVLKMAIIHHDDLYNDDEDADASGTYRSDWVLLTRNAQFVNQREIAEITSDPKTFSNKIRMWTDEQSNLLQILDADKDSWLEWLRNLAL